MDESYGSNDMAGEMPIGVQDFKEMREGEFLYVDKSDMIPQILSDKAKVYLYTRPRRFGKSLNLSMLDAFFNLRYPKDNGWFDGLKVSDCEECQIHKNAYPVIYLDFKDLRSESYEEFLHKLKSKLSKLYAMFGYLRNSAALDEMDVERFVSVFRCTVNNYDVESTLYDLSYMLYKHHGKKVIILLDEYDNPINHAYGKPFQKDIINIMGGLLSSALKGNDSLQFGVVTGVMQISKESIFSGLNNLKVDNIFSKRFDEMFGFTDNEVKSICEDYGHPEKYEEAKEWYDGYRFGNADVYNPWSIIRYVDEDFEPQTYWAGTSGNDILNDLLDMATPEMWDEFKVLVEGGSILYSVKPTITFQDLQLSERNIYSMMVMSGYLTVKCTEDGVSRISIPNGEMAHVFGDTIIDRLYSGSSTLVKALADAFIAGDVTKIEQHLYDLFATSAGIAMLDNEHSYQAFIVGILAHLSGRYSVKSDFEGGNGRYDIQLERIRGDSPNIVIELKRIPIDSSDDVAESTARKALEQIRDRDYIHGLTGNTLLYGIAFRNKKATVVYDRM